MTESEIRSCMKKALENVRNTTPLAPSITNTVTINFVANAQLAAGGSAACVYLADEGKALAQASKSIYINMGTQFPFYAASIRTTAKQAHECGNKWVLDPVAIGIGKLRTRLLKQMKNYKPQIIRANASEAIALANLWKLSDAVSNVKGVDSFDSTESAVPSAKALASFTGGAVSVSGKEDIVTDGTVAVKCSGGSRFMPMVTGAGCSLGGVHSVFACVAEPFIASLAATCLYNITGKRAEEKSTGPGDFQVNFLNELYRATPEDLFNAEIEII